MPQRLDNVVGFRGDRLFNGAVDIGWYGTDEKKTKTASEAFVFHGPQYHGVQQEDVGDAHGHRLIDTASLAHAIVRRCYGLEDRPFTLAIAGYGTGKSHLGLTFASLVHSPYGKTAQNILSAIAAADASIAGDIRIVLEEAQQPCLPLTLNGMRSFDLAAEVTKQVVRTLKADGHDSRPLDDLRPRFGQAAHLIHISNETVITELVTACDADSPQELLTALEQQDEHVYAQVHDFFAAQGMSIRALAGESVRDVIDVTVREYCGKGKPYRCLLVLFDEFGKYTEFATVRSQIAGSGALQDLFEAIQANADSACFVGFIQFELNAYLQRVAPEYKNEILRYVTRYQAAHRVYLSINLETLIASLLEKRQAELIDKWFASEDAESDSHRTMAALARWFPESRNHRLWGDAGQFHSIIRKGCWPLSPYATWFLFYLAAAGKHLQERSVLSLLDDVFHRFEKTEVSDAGEWSLAPVDLWSNALQQELISSEEMGQQGSITHAYASVMERHGSRLSHELRRLLCAVVLASKLGLQAADKDDAIEALGELAGMSPIAADDGVRLLQEDYNVLEWDEAFKAFDILSDAVPRNQFLAFVRQRVANSYDEAGKAKLFAGKAMEWCDLLTDLDCDFAEENKITTREWRYRAVTSSLDYLPQQIKIASDRWAEAIGVDDPRGAVVYAYVPPSTDPAATASDARRLLRAAAHDYGISSPPILVVLLWDESGALGQALAEYAILDESLTDEDRVRFGNLIGAHRARLHDTIRDQIDGMVKQRRYVTGLRDELEAHRLTRAGSELFARIYKSPIPFPFDGFSTTKGNAADTCQELTTELLLGKLDHAAVIAKPVKSKNRALTVLDDTWDIFSTKGDVTRRPKYPIVRTLTEKWDDALASGDQRLSVADTIRQLCRPPYGANVASAGLLLGVFVSPRLEKLVIVRDGQQFAVSQWVQDGIFRSKLIDLSAVRDVALTLLGEASSEWETLLDEWEQAETYLAQQGCLVRSRELKARVPIPPSLAYKEQHLHAQALVTIEALAKMEKAQEEAFSKLEEGEERQDIGLLTWGAANLKKLCDQMQTEKPCWTDSQIAEIQPQVDRARQSIIQDFPQWLLHQTPFSDSPDNIGHFKQKMLRGVGGNLKTLGLDEQYQNLEARVGMLVRNAELVAEARQLIRETSSWLDQHVDACRIVRVAAIRGLRDAGKLFASKLQGVAQSIAQRIDLPEITSVRTRLTAFLSMLKDADESAVKRYDVLLDSKLRSREEMESLLQEAEDLTRVFEGCENDCRDLQLIRRGLQMLVQDYDYLQSNRLGWTDFEALTQKLQKEAEAAFGGAQLPWSVTEIISEFAATIARQRKQASLSWIQQCESDAEALPAMEAAEAIHLRDRASSPPAFLTDQHRERLGRVVVRINTRLETLKIDWLVEEFKTLLPDARKTFLKIINCLFDAA